LSSGIKAILVYGYFYPKYVNFENSYSPKQVKFIFVDVLRKNENNWRKIKTKRAYQLWLQIVERISLVYISCAILRLLRSP